MYVDQGAASELRGGEADREPYYGFFCSTVQRQQDSSQVGGDSYLSPFVLIECMYVCMYVYVVQSQKATVFAMDCIPRMLSRGQAFDALTSQVWILIISAFKKSLIF